MSRHTENMCVVETSNGSSPYQDNFFFSNDGSSGYLECIVPDNCFRPGSSSSANSLYSRKSTSSAPSDDDQKINSFNNTNSIEHLASSFSPQEGSYNMSAIFNNNINSNALRVEHDGCMDDNNKLYNEYEYEYPISESGRSYGLMNESASSTICFPPFEDVDLGYHPLF
ncbi:unnamed protein product [Lupinus luteus]|uniref:Uncharacterized protein n=1 Tax=Lupinus luteus TaxID=3873 RepID=A0AAV1XWV7_LUPLU